MSHAKNILIIDDSESDTLLMKEAIEKTNISESVQIVKDSNDALSFLNQKAPYQDAPRPD